MSEKTVLEVLQGALKLLQAKTRWIKGAYGKTGTGTPLSETQVCTNPAVCYCAMGALYKANDCVDDETLVNGAADILYSQLSNYWKNMNDEECLPSGGVIVIWNDAKGRTHAQVVATFKKAIAAVKAAA